MFGSRQPQQYDNTDRPVLIDGKTGRVIEQEHPEPRDTGRGQGQPERGSAQFIYDQDGRATPYRPGQEW